VTMTDLQSVITRSDIVSIHIPATPETHHLFNRETIATMKDGAFLVNAARGALVDLDDLADAGNHVCMGTLFCRKLFRMAGIFGQNHRYGVSALTERIDHAGKDRACAPHSGHGIYDEQDLFWHGERPFYRFPQMTRTRMTPSICLSASAMPSCTESTSIMV